MSVGQGNGILELCFFGGQKGQGGLILHKAYIYMKTPTDTYVGKPWAGDISLLVCPATASLVVGIHLRKATEWP